jgi:hypothetical protein
MAGVEDRASNALRQEVVRPQMSDEESPEPGVEAGPPGASREADWVDLIGADTFGAIFPSSALRTSGLRAVAVAGALARAFVRIGRAGPPGGCAGRGGERNLAVRARPEMELMFRLSLGLLDAGS